MTTDLSVLSKGSKYWPVVVAVSFGPVVGSVLARWLPFHFAMGIAGFAAWTFVGVVFLRRSQPKWGLPRWLVAILIGVVTGCFVGLLAFFFPLK